jgi:hypothetical protein
MGTDEFWKNWQHAEVASRWGGEDWITVEDLDQAFKQRMGSERAASYGCTGCHSTPCICAELAAERDGV